MRYVGVLAPQPWIEPTLPALEVQSLNYWATRGVPVIKYLSELNYIQISRESVFLEERASSTKALDWESPLYVDTYQEGQQTSMSRAMVLIIWEIFRITNYWALSQTYWIRNSGARAWKSVFKKCFCHTEHLTTADPEWAQLSGRKVAWVKEVWRQGLGFKWQSQRGWVMMPGG